MITSQPSDNPPPVRPFSADDNQPTKVGVDFSVDGRLFCYNFKLNNQRILQETIKERSLSNQRKTAKTLFSRSWDPQKGSYLVNEPSFKLPKGIYARQGSSVITSANLTGDTDHIGTKIFDYWNKSVIVNVWQFGNQDDTHLHSNAMTEIALDFFYDNPALKTAAIDILSRLGVGAVDFDRHRGPVGNDYYYRILHRPKEAGDMPIPIVYESSGTKRVILLLMYIIQALQKPGGIAAIDELDAYLHPDIVESLVQIFTTPETNPNKAQLLFSSHAHQLLAGFDKQQITLAEKDNQGATNVWRLDDVSGVRSDDNYYAKYIAGAYSAKPKID